MTTYNPVRPLPMADKLREMYWNLPVEARFAYELAFLLTGFSFITACVFVAAA